MMRGANSDVLGGAALVCLGAGAAYYASTRYDMGSSVAIGPGVFPAGVGVLLAAMGFVILLAALWRQRQNGVSPDWMPLAMVVGGLAGFAFAVRPLGMVPAIVILTLISSYADGRLGLARTLALAVILSVFAVLIFRVLLGAPFAIYRWPF